jgi:hypothetical protein
MPSGNIGIGENDGIHQGNSTFDVTDPQSAAIFFSKGIEIKSLNNSIIE